MEDVSAAEARSDWWLTYALLFTVVSGDLGIIRVKDTVVLVGVIKNNTFLKIRTKVRKLFHIL